MKNVSVVILNWNGSSMLRRFLPQVVEWSEEADVVVADNGSTDDSLELLRESFPMVRTLCFPKNYGFAEGYNKALQQISTPYAILLNDDVVVTPHWLRPLLAFMEKNADVAACQPKVRSERCPECFEYAGACGGFMDIYGYPYCRGRMLGTVEEDDGQYDDVCDVFWATGAALMIRTPIYKEVGGLDSRFFAHMEEVDLCWRLRSRGHRICCIPQSVVYHVGGATLNKSNPQKAYLNFRNNLFMLYKNLPEKDLKRVMRVRFFLDYIAACKSLFSGRFKEAEAIVRARREFKCRRAELVADRRTNLLKTVNVSISELNRHSLLAAYYLKGIRTFSRWHG